METRAVLYISAICWQKKLKFDREILPWSKGDLYFCLPGKASYHGNKDDQLYLSFMAYKAPIRWRSFVAMDNELPRQQEESSISQLLVAYKAQIW